MNSLSRRPSVGLAGRGIVIAVFFSFASGSAQADNKGSAESSLALIPQALGAALDHPDLVVQSLDEAQRVEEASSPALDQIALLG